MLDCERQLTLEKRKAERIKLRRRTIDIFGSSSSSSRSICVCSPSKEIPVPALVSRVERKSIEQSDDISIYEAIQLAHALKIKAGQEFALKNYSSALLTSTNAIDAAEDAKNKAGSIMLQLAAVTIMTACSIRAATCYLKLDRCDEAEDIAGKAIVMIGNALEPKLDESMNTRTRASKNCTGDRHPYNFGGWRVKSFLVLARVSIRMQKYEDAIQIMDNAHVVCAKYTASDSLKQTLPKVSTGCLLSSEEDDRISISLGEELQEPELSEEIQVTQKSLGSSPCVEETDDGPQPASVQRICAVKRNAGLILDESLSERTKKEELAHDVLDSSLLATDSEDEDEEKHGDQQEMPQLWASVVKESGMPPNGPDGKGPVEVFDPELIFSISRSDGEF
jgi:tetratricopeptide (TPR) repeat protein